MIHREEIIEVAHGFGVFASVDPLFVYPIGVATLVMVGGGLLRRAVARGEEQKWQRAVESTSRPVEYTLLAEAPRDVE